MKLLSDRIAILQEQEAPENTTSGGLILANVSSQPTKKNIGEVMFTGPGRLDLNGNVIPLSVSPGSRVLFTPFSGQSVVFQEQEYLIVRESDIIAII